MSKLYPRLLPSAASEFWRSMQETDQPPDAGTTTPSLEHVVFAATGGTRVTPDELTGIRLDLRTLAHEAGAPDRVDDRARVAFDFSTARYLHARLMMTPGEASQRTVWSYFGLVLVPDVCAWRFPPRPDRGYFEERFRCADLTRHALARLWFRAHLLHDPAARDPYELVDVLGENDMDQILTRRRDVAATPGLARALVRAHRDDPDGRGSQVDRDVFLDSLKRLLRLAAFIDLDSRSDEELHQLVSRLRRQSREVLSAAAAG